MPDKHNFFLANF